MNEWNSFDTTSRPVRPGRYWMWNGSRVLLFKLPMDNTCWAGVTHWMECQEPEPPKSEAEKAWDEWWSNQGGEFTTTGHEVAFIAGFEKGRAKP